MTSAARTGLILSIMALTGVSAVKLLKAPDPIQVTDKEIQTWKYNSQPYSLEADGKAIFYHGYTQSLDDPYNGHPYSVDSDGKVIFFHGQ